MYLYSKHIGDTNVDIILYICVLTLFGYPHGASSNRNSILINYMTQLFLHHLIGSHSCTSNRKDEQRYDSFRGKRSCTKENHPLVPIPIQLLCPLHWSDDGHLFQSPEQASSACASPMHVSLQDQRPTPPTCKPCSKLNSIGMYPIESNKAPASRFIPRC